MPTTLSFTLWFSGHGVFDQERAALAVLSQTSATDHAVRARLQAILAASRILAAPSEAAAAALESAREATLAGDEVSRGWSLVAACAVDVSPQSLAARLSMTHEALKIAQITGELEFVPTAYFLHLGALVEAAAIDELSLALSPTGTLLLAFPWLERERHVAWFRCLQATIDGQAALAEQLAAEALAVAQDAGDPDAQSVFIGQLAIIRWMQARVVELEPAFLQARQVAPHEPVWAVALAWMWLKQGRLSAARAVIITLAPIAQLPIDHNWLATACILAEVAAELGQHEIAQTTYEALLPLEDRLVTIGLGVACWGTVSRPLALIAVALGDTNTAITHYRRAVAMTSRIGAHPWLAESQTELARLLVRRSDHNDLEEAASLSSEAAATGRALKLRGIEDAAAAVVAAAKPTTRSHQQTSILPEISAAAKIRVLGAFEVVSEAGVVARWQSRKARQLLKVLVANRGVAVSRESVMHLLWPDEPTQRLANRFSVAATTVRRALDPPGTLPNDTYLDTRGSLIRLCIERIDVDVELFLARARAALLSTESLTDRTELLTAALASYQGALFTDEPGEQWAHKFEREVATAYFAVCHALAEASEASGDQLTRLGCYQNILADDEYNQRAHEGLIDALTRLGASGQAAAARKQYAQRLNELGIVPNER